MAMIHRTRLYWRPWYGTGLVASITSVGTINMISRFAARDGSIVTAGTDADNLAMINGRRSNRCPVSREFLVAGITDVSAIDVSCIFTAGSDTIMTGETIT